ncbi:hypothetical protein QAD02_004077 [Eretmocerus hayati]|uniref:Uncharacterized protein n=1 Tax=Eretmocerus hayati TaxID=131215 RepID=A0ACC2NNY8_9HYME|nr:hypothetical protein QAD02_004077 [Eretmocerus hayati]
MKYEEGRGGHGSQTCSSASTKLTFLSDLVFHDLLQREILRVLGYRGFAMSNNTQKVNLASIKFPQRPHKFGVVKVPQKCAGFGKDTYLVVANKHIGKINNHNVIRVMQGPYSNEDPGMIKGILKNPDVAPPISWPYVSCGILRHTETDVLAENLISQLETQAITPSNNNVIPTSTLGKTLSQKLSCVPVMSNKKAVSSPSTVPINQVATPVGVSTSVTVPTDIDQNCSQITVDTPHAVARGTSDELNNNHSPHPISLVKDPEQTPITISWASARFNEILDKLNWLTTQFVSLKKSTNDSLASLEAKVVNVQKDVDQLAVHVKNERELRKNENIMTESEFAQEHNLKFPLETISDFNDFEAKIGPATEVRKVNSKNEEVTKVVNSKVFEDLKTHLISCTDSSKALEVSLDKLCKSMFSGDVMRNITSQRASRKDSTKIIMKTTRFFVCLRDAFAHVYANKIVVGDGKIILDCMKIIINKGHGWGVRSSNQSQKSLEDSDRERSILDGENDNVIISHKKPPVDDEAQSTKRRSMEIDGDDEFFIFSEESTNVD